MVFSEGGLSHQAFKSFVNKFFVSPLGGIMLLVFFIQTTYDSMDPHHGSGSEIGGVGLVFCLSVAILLLGICVMVYQRCSVLPSSKARSRWEVEHMID